MRIENYIGLTDYNEYVFQKVYQGIIKGFDVFYKVELVDGTDVLTQSAWTHEVTLKNKKTYKSGNKAATIKRLPKAIEGLYTCETVSCEECGAVHDLDQQTWTIVGEYSAVCLGCRTADSVLIELKRPSDLFRSKNLEDLDLSEYTEVETLFCDSSGFGSSSERALTKAQAEKRALEVINENTDQLYSGITGIGQFQVYVSIFKKGA